MNNRSEFLWYIPNDTKAGHRGDAADPAHNSLDTLAGQAKAMEEHGWKGALIGRAGADRTRSRWPPR
jgi:alkanesulfonate monooxygenase